MSFYQTGNPVPSIDPRDLDDNAKHIDEIVNSTELTFTDRLGTERQTMAGVIEGNNSLAANLAGAGGGALVSTKRTEEPNAQIFNIQTFHKDRAVYAATDFGITFDGVADQTTKFAQMVSDLAGIASARNGQCPSVEFKYGRLRIDGNILLYPFMRFKSNGPMDIYAQGNSGATFWIRNDLLFNQGNEADYNVGPVFDGSNGAIRLIGNDEPGSVAFRIGNDPAMGVSGKYAAFCGLQHMYLKDFDKAISFTNNNVFANRFYNLKMSDINVVAISNEATAVVNGGERIVFSGCFINNCEGGIETNGEIEIEYSGGSISYTKKPVRLNGNHLALLHLNTHFEKFGTDADYALIKSTSSSNSLLPTVNFGDYIIPSNYLTPGPTVPTGNVMRTMFKGKMNLNCKPTNIHSDNFGIDGTEFQFLCDSDVIVRGASNVKVGGSISAQLSSVSRVPDPQGTAITRFTAGANTTLTAVTGGSPSRTAIKLTSIGAQRGITTDYFPVVAGESLFGSVLADLSATTAGGDLNMRMNWYYSDKVLISSTSFLNSDLSPKAGQTGWKHAYLGTGRQIAPPGSCFARIEILTDAAFAGDMLLTSFMHNNA